MQFLVCHQVAVRDLCAIKSPSSIPVGHDTCSSGVVRTKTPHALFGLRSLLGVLSSCGPTLPYFGGRDASQGGQGSKGLLQGAWVRVASSYFRVGGALGLTL